jgi:DsbC/DsbD-like thiol-disulfide interchange protein
MNARTILLSLILLVSPGIARAEEPFASDWAPSLKSQARLIADGAGGAAFQVKLAPGAITYWRDPGESGIPPTFDFSGSKNLARAEVGFPAPKRIAEPDGSEAFGYSEGVVFPIFIEARDSSQPVMLAVNANYAVCEKICLPARASLGLTLPTGATSPFAAEIEAAREKVPRKEDASAIGVQLTALDARNWRLCVPPRAGAARDLFVEPPEGWWIEAKLLAPDAAQNCFALALRQAPADAAFPASVRATITGGAGAVETEFKLAPKS